MSKVGRNDPCPCGSGKKYKKCCEQKTAMQRRTFSNLSSPSVKANLDKISGRISTNLGPKAVSAIRTQAASIADRFSKVVPEKKDNGQAEEKDQITEKKNIINSSNSEE